DERPAELVLQVVDARLEDALVLAGGVVLGVLAEVAHVARGGDALGHRDHLGVLQAVEIGPLLVEAFARHRDAVIGHCRCRSCCLAWAPVKTTIFAGAPDLVKGVYRFAATGGSARALPPVAAKQV